MKKWAFTLAEVLISLAVIGVISAMTLPTLNSTLTTRQLETGTLKAYNMMQDAISRYMADNEIDPSVGIGTALNDETKKQAFVDNYFKVMVKYTANTHGISYQKLDRTTFADPFTTCYMLNNGILFEITSENIGTANAQNNVPKIVIDINGVKGPNMLNKDLWCWYIKDDGTIVDRNQLAGVLNSSQIDTDFANCKGDGANITTYGCFAKFLTNGYKFEY